MLNPRNALICSYYMPQGEVDSYSRRLLHFIEFLTEAGWNVTCLAKNTKGVGYIGSALERMGVRLEIGPEAHIEQLTKDQHFDIAILGFWHIAEPLIKQLRACSPVTRIIVDSGDLHFLRHARRIIRESNEIDELQVLDSYYADEMVRELCVYAAADAVWAVSRKEAEFIGDFVGDTSRSQVVPDCEELAPSNIPFSQRRGMFFVGNFEHLPNGEAVEYLCTQILPQFDPDFLADHPVYIAGNAMTDRIRSCAQGLPFVKVVGWIPSVMPYLERVRVSLAPLLHGAGTKRKIIQALALGTPTVSTSIGVEGFDLRDGEEVLVADDPIAYANAIARLLIDESLWTRLATNGRERILKENGREVARRKFQAALKDILSKPSRGLVKSTATTTRSNMGLSEYREVIHACCATICSELPASSTVSIVTKGDERFMELEGRVARHFPQLADGRYAGHYPADSAEAINHLEEVRKAGADYLVMPKSAYWWLEFYPGLTEHLQNHYRLLEIPSSNHCLIFSLNESASHTPIDLRELVPANTEGGNSRELATSFYQPSQPNAYRRRVNQTLQAQELMPLDELPSQNVLVVVCYEFDNCPNIASVGQNLAKSDRHRVELQLVASYENAADGLSKDRLGEITNPEVSRLMNLVEERHKQFDYIILCDANVEVPPGFLDQLLSVQSALGFQIAQPSYDFQSGIDQLLGCQQKGVAAREVSYATNNPVLSISHSAVKGLRDKANHQPGTNGHAHSSGGNEINFGIIDAIPIRFAERDSEVPALSKNFASFVSQLNREVECFRASNQQEMVALMPLQADLVQNISKTFGAVLHSKAPRISVVLPTHNRSELLHESLKSLEAQLLPKTEFEVIVIDDGSTDRTHEICRNWERLLPLKYYFIQQSGIGAAKNLGVYAARSPIILFFDDDDVAHEGLLKAHLDTHERYPMENVAVLGYTTWSPALEVTEVMRFITDVGHYLFSYSDLIHGQSLDFTYFWGGRSSCKRSLLTRLGAFRQDFQFGSEDIEAGFRLSKRLIETRLGYPVRIDKEDPEHLSWLKLLGIVVVYNRNAIQYMNRTVTYDAFLQRCLKQGKSQFQFSQHYEDTLVHHWCTTKGAVQRWRDRSQMFDAKVARVQEIEASLKHCRDSIQPEEYQALLKELYELYWWTFDAAKAKGIADATAQDEIVGNASNYHSYLNVVCD